MRQAWASPLGAVVKAAGVEISDLMMLWAFMAHGRVEEGHHLHPTP